MDLDSQNLMNEKQARQQAIENATKYATEIPFKVMETAYQLYGSNDSYA